MKKPDVAALISTLLTHLHLAGEGWSVTFSTSSKQVNLAQIVWEPSRRFAHISLRPQRSIYADAIAAERPYALALTLAHELFHIRLQGHLEMEDVCAEGNPFNAAFEYALDVLARELVTGLVTRGIISEEPVPAFKR